LFGWPAVASILQDITDAPRGSYFVVVTSTVYVANALAALRGVGGGYGWLGVPWRQSLALAAGGIPVWILSRAVPRPFAIALLLALLAGTPVLLLVIGWRGWRSARAGQWRQSAVDHG